MITREDVVHFYEKYKKNLKKEEYVQAELLRVNTQEMWINKLKQKNRLMKQLYIENEELLDLFVRPIIEKRTELKIDIAEEIVHQIRIANDEGFEDNLAMLELLEAINPFVQKYCSLHCRIWCLSLLGIFYNCSSSSKEGEKGFDYFNQVCDLKDVYFYIEDFDTRKRIIYAFYNRPIVLVNFHLAEADALLSEIQRALSFWNDPRVREKDGEDFDFDGLIEELHYDVFGNYVISHTKQNADHRMLEKAKEVLCVYYAAELKKNSNPYAMLDEIYCYYKYTLFYLGEISCTEFLEDYKKFCDYCIENDTLEHPDGYWESRLFQVAINHLPGILKCLNLYKDEFHGDSSMRNACVDAYLKLIKRIPKTGNCRFVNDVVCRSVYEFLGLVTSGDVAADVLVNVMVTRDEITLIHSQIVSQIVELLLNEIFDKAPELLIGCLGCENLVDVLENRNLFETYLSQATKLFDIGKLKDADIVNKQSRRLTEKEYARIYMHAEAGAEIVKNIDELAQFYPIVLGHHKSWNGKMGYPTYFDTTKEKNRFLIELVHLSDCLDAATDFIGRSYKNPKTFEECLEEFIQGSGSLYCPDLVNLIVNNVSLQKKLKKLLNEDRIRTYDEVYGIALDPKQAKIAWEDVQIRNSGDEKDHIIDILHERNKANDAFVKAVVRQTILTLEVDLRSGDFRVYSQNAQRLFPHIENGKYQTFLSEYLEPLCFKQDWDKLEYQLRFSQILHTLVRQNGVFECELRLLIDGAYRWVRLQFLKSDEENIIPKTMLILISDVQEMHFRKEQMESVLKEAYETAVQANQVKSRFMSNMSHDIRTPMNGIMGMTQIALHHLQDSARVEDCLRKIEESSRDLMELVNEVLDMSRIESGKTQLEMDNVCVKDVLQSSIDVCMPMLESAMHTLCVDIDTLGEDVVITDPVRLRQIFINILSNAIKYTPNHGTITIHGKKVFEHAEDGISYYLTFQDTGIGMSKAFQKRVFEPFARESTAYSSSVQGTGLGLSIVKSMVDMMGGTINMDSEVGKGTKFSITLQFPLASEKSISKQVEHINKRFDGTRVLLAEDNAINREIADEILSSIGVKVDHAKDGNEVVEMFQHSANGQYDLIFMDIQMPYKNGYEATTCIRALDKEDAKTIPIIALSANVFKEDITKALQSGMNDHLKKPIEMGALCKVLELYIHK